MINPVHLLVFRFDREIHMEPPNATDRYALFQAQINKMPLDSSVDIGKNNKAIRK
jgi:ATP-dependent 26S proteasome regulatory subunit